MKIEENINPIISTEELNPDVENQIEEEDIIKTIDTGHDTEKEKEEEIAVLEEEKEKTREEIEKTRENLGLPPSEEEPPSIKSINEQIEKAGSDNADTKKERIEFQLEKQHYSRILDSAKNLISVFNKRNSDRLSPLLDDSNLARIKSAVTNIEELAGQKIFDADNFNIELNRLFTSINSIGDAPKGQAVREDVQSLSALIFRLKDLRENSGNLIRLMSDFNPEETEKSRNVLHGLCASCEKKWLYIARLRDIVGGRR